MLSQTTQKKYDILIRVLGLMKQYRHEASGMILMLKSEYCNDGLIEHMWISVNEGVHHVVVEREEQKRMRNAEHVQRQEDVTEADDLLQAEALLESL